MVWGLSEIQVQDIVQNTWDKWPPPQVVYELTRFYIFVDQLDPGSKQEEYNNTRRIEEHK